MAEPRRPLWLWPLGLFLLWVLMAPLVLVVYAVTDRTFLIAEYQVKVEPFGRPFVLVPWVIVLALITIAAYWASYWGVRRRRPRFGLVLLMIPWSLLLGGWWYAANHGRFQSVSEWALLALFTLGPPVILLTLEAVLGEIVFARGMRLFQQGEPAAATRLLRLAEHIRPGEASITKTVGLALFRAREWGPAEEWLGRARQAYPRDPELAWPLASLALRRKAYEEAVPLIQTHLEENPLDQAAWERLTEAHLALGQLTDGIRAFEHLDRNSDINHLIRLAELYMRNRNFEQALAVSQRARALERMPWPRYTEMLERIVGEQPDSIAVLEAMAKLAEEMERPEDVLKWNERILNHRPHDASLRRKVMQQSRELHKPVQLEAHLRHFLGGPEPKREDLSELIELLIQRRAWDELRQWLARAKEEYPDAWEFLLAEAQLALVNGQWEQCFQLCHMARARARTPQDLHRVDAILGRLERARSQNELQALRQAINESTDQIPLRWELVERLTQLRAFEMVVTELDEILRRNPGQQDRVAATLEELLRTNAENFTLLNYLRDLLMRERSLDAVYHTTERMAVQSLNPDQVMRESAERILQMDPRHVLSLHWMAEHAHRTGDWAQAVNLFEAWFQAEPAAADNPENLQRLFEAAAATQDIDRGIDLAKRLLDKRHREVENLKTLARLYQQHGRLDEAHRCFLCAREVDNQDREVRDAIHTLDAEIRQDRVSEIQQLLEKDPDNTALNHELGDLLYSFQRYTEAIPHLQRAEANPAIANLCRAKIAHALAQRGMLDLAHETLADVKLEAEDPDQLEVLKAIHFNLGEIFREEGQNERALDAFKRLFRVDAGYRNVVQKLEKLTS